MLRMTQIGQPRPYTIASRHGYADMPSDMDVQVRCRVQAKTTGVYRTLRLKAELRGRHTVLFWQRYPDTQWIRCTGSTLYRSRRVVRRIVAGCRQRMWLRVSSGSAAPIPSLPLLTISWHEERECRLGFPDGYFVEAQIQGSRLWLSERNRWESIWYDYEGPLGCEHVRFLLKCILGHLGGDDPSSHCDGRYRASASYVKTEAIQHGPNHVVVQPMKMGHPRQQCVTNFTRRWDHPQLLREPEWRNT